MEQFLFLAGELGEEMTGKMEHGEIEDFISEAGVDVLRLLRQSRLDLHCNQEKREAAVTGTDGVVRTRCRCGCERSPMTIFGEVTVRRKGYGAPGAAMVFPMDAGLNLPRDKHSHGLRRRVAEYLEKYEPLFHYHQFLKEGLPIAPGVIEGACRHLIEDRMDLTGARWRLKRPEAVLRIRSLRSGRDLDTYWPFHRTQERKRNYPLPHMTVTEPCRSKRSAPLFFLCMDQTQTQAPNVVRPR